MNRIILLLAAWVLLSFLPVYAQNGSSHSDLTGLRVDVVYLASDYLEGRETGKAGEALAAEYIADRFRQIGLTPKGLNGTWFQSFDFKYLPNPHATTGGEDRTGRNVIGFLDNGAAATVIIGAHYDHLGHGISGSLHTGDPAIHNGADDNASGVASLLYLAEQLAGGKAKNNNYLFLAFSGEELGLFGSKKFVEGPLWKETGTVNYMLNMDMVGRLNTEKSLVVNGAGTSPVWKEVLNSISVGGITVKTTDSGVGPSDHTSFYLQDLPVLHFFTGQHSEYHKPVDDAHLINYEGLLDVSNFILAVIEKLDGKGKLEFTKTKDDQQGRQAARFKVSLGVMPDYTYQGEGMRIDGVTDGKPAAKAGLRKGDILLQIGDTVIKDIYAYMEGLAKLNAGETTRVVVKRGEEKLTFEVTL